MRVPLAAPVAVGMKFTVNGTLLPAAIVTGSESPLIVNTALFKLPAETVTLAPLAVSVPEADPLVPTTTLPTAMVVGLTLRVPTAATPVPESGMVRVGFDAFEVTVTVPLAVPADVGVNVTVKLVLAPAVNVTGVVIVPKLKPVPLMLTPETVTAEPPVLVIFSVRD